MRFPAEMRKLRADPSLAQRAVEELLRYDGPTTAQGRVVQVEHELHGRTLKAGDRVFLMINSANRDPRAYPDPDRLDVERDGVPHLAFGFGRISAWASRSRGSKAKSACPRCWRDFPGSSRRASRAGSTRWSSGAWPSFRFA